ncbi:molybdopterin-containing oxidoreductase family protein [Leucothrix arctica]|uniref:Molybdopterin-binding oxidoreductase n=1 Tax=Leucothrix arctica TaxID=1481894 RepID=A0A317CGT9_9GAMM|nr:molybdopterin-dependent oxidoreductase [Leucothrix arctica]PWQ97607.1 molybdopterin-binding oxidoreductase [Leucothrix arctica]
MSTATETRLTVCTLDCPDTCSLAVKVQDEKVISIRASEVNPYTDKAICSKVARFYPDYVHGEQRLTHPLKRTGSRGSGEYEQISWEQAIDLVHEGFSQAIEQHGPQSVIGFNYAGPHGELAANSLDRRFFNKLGATQLDRGPLCGAVKSGAYASLFGDTAGMPPEQVMESDLLVMWGNNATVSNLHLSRMLKKTQAAGCKLIVIDPKRIAIANRADLFLQINPGTDVVLAMALAAELERRGGLDNDFIEQWVYGAAPYLEQARQYSREDVLSICGLSLASFDALADYYMQAKNVSASFGNGIERGKSGGSGLRAAMALQALTGNFGRSGAGVIAKAGLSFPRDSERLEGTSMVPKNTRTLNILDVSKSILDDTLAIPVKALMIYNHNPIATHPDQHRMQRALSKESVFIAGCDVVMTDSMKYADVILPAASMFEIEDIYASYGHNYLQRAEAVIAPVGEALANTEIFRRLAARFGFDDASFKRTDKQLMDEAFIDGDPRLQGKKPSKLGVDEALFIESDSGQPIIMCDTVKPSTPSGKIELFSDALEQKYGFGVPRYEPLARAEKFPFMIISPSSNDRTNATFGGCSESLVAQSVEIHPEDAAASGITHGELVRVWNEQGEVSFKAQVSDKVKQGVLYTPKGAWKATSQSGQTVNALIPADVRTDILDGACYNDTLVAIESY